MGNSYDEQYEFRIATVNDIDAIMDFIDRHWKKNHIMAVHRDFFEYEFLEEDGTVNFLMAIDKKKNTIECLNGFLKASHDKEHMDVWGSIWKVLDGNMGMLGAELIKRRKDLIGCRCDLCVGDNPKTAIPVLKTLLKRYTAKMQHYYILAERNDYKIAKIEYAPKRTGGYANRYDVIQLGSIAEVKKRFDWRAYRNDIPYKDDWYIDHRFFKHPVYVYEVYGIEKEGSVKALAVFRKQEYADRVAIRFVDYIGDRTAISGMGAFLEKMLKETEDAEYIDFYCAGLAEEDVLAAGFSVLGDGDANIIPNYFGPFLQKNIDIWVDSREKTSLFTKADADQDRPNVMGKRRM